MTDTSLVQTETPAPGVVVIRLNRPEKRNALSTAVMIQFCDALDAAEADESLRVVILCGAGPTFCAGLDLKEAGQPDLSNESAKLVARTLRTVYQSRLISIAVVHGAAVAGGAGIMTACDFVIAESGTRIGYPEVHRGLVAALVANLLCNQVSQRYARELLLLGELIDAEWACEIGLVNRVVDADAGLDTARTLAQQILRGGPEAVVRTKRLVNENTTAEFARRLQQTLDDHLAARGSAEAQEGLAAFFEKRQPNWAPKENDER